MDKGRNERGNVVLLTLSLLGVMVLMFLVLSNYVKAFSVKQQAMTSAELASFSATAALYTEIEKAIEDYDREWYRELEALTDFVDHLKDNEGDTEDEEDQDLIDPDFFDYLDLGDVDVTDLQAIVAFINQSKSLRERIDERSRQLRIENNWTENEAHIEAINQVLAERLQSHSKPQKLQEHLLAGLQSATGPVREAVKSTVQQNGGTVKGTEITMFNERVRIEVKTSVRYKAIHYDRFLPESARSIYQSGEGPRVKFVEKVDGWTSKKLTP